MNRKLVPNGLVASGSDGEDGCVAAVRKRPLWRDTRTPSGMAMPCLLPTVGCACASCVAPPDDRAQGAWTLARVRDAMARDAAVVRADETIGALATLFLTKRLRGVPVIDERGRAVGVVTAAGLGKERGAGVRVVADVMTPVTAWVREDAPLWRAARLMARERIACVPVLSNAAEVVGALSTMDVVRWLDTVGGVVMQRG